MSKDRQHQHDKGERDALEGKYDPPHERVEDLIGNILGGESRSAYEAGRSTASTEGSSADAPYVQRINSLLASIATHEQSIQTRLDAIDRKLRQL